MECFFLNYCRGHKPGDSTPARSAGGRGVNWGSPGSRGRGQQQHGSNGSHPITGLHEPWTRQQQNKQYASDSENDHSVLSSTLMIAGVPAMKKTLVDSMLAGEYIDLAELPPARGRGKSLAGSLEGKVVLLHAAEYFQAKRLIPDLATWVQCFSIYMAVLISQHNERTPSLLMYMASIAKLSQKFKWPSWIVYDHSYRQEAADSRRWDWSKVDARIHAQCFTGIAISAEGWCRYCHSIDHASEYCPVKPVEPPKRQQQNLNPPPPAKREPGKHICKKFNKYGGECNFGTSCRFQHICILCRGPHPASRCNGK